MAREILQAIDRPSDRPSVHQPGVPGLSDRRAVPFAVPLKGLWPSASPRSCHPIAAVPATRSRCQVRHRTCAPGCHPAWRSCASTICTCSGPSCGLAFGGQDRNQNETSTLGRCMRTVCWSIRYGTNNQIAVWEHRTAGRTNHRAGPDTLGQGRVGRLRRYARHRDVHRRDARPQSNAAGEAVARRGG